jgi:peptidoglycan hydrolase-like protein with peptidoglycan-binding domain
MTNAPLSVGAYGPSVARLHALLRRQGFSLPESEVNRDFFGPITRQVVQEFQKKMRLPVTGQVDERTDSALGTVASACTEAAATTGGTPPAVGQVNMAAPGESGEAESSATAGSGHATLRGGWFPRILAKLFCILAGIAFGSMLRRKGSPRIPSTKSISESLQI